jgi:putative transposase
MRFVIAAEKREEPLAALCREFGVSRKTGYEWLGRHREEGIEGLLDRSRAPHHHPQAIADEIAERCVAVRRAHPTLGAGEGARLSPGGRPLRSTGRRRARSACCSTAKV